MPEVSEENLTQPRPEGEPARVEAAEEASGTAEPLPREAELEATKDRLLRALADTENLRRRSAREVEEARKYAITGFARELLEVSDNLSRALESIPPRARQEIELVSKLAEGVELTEKALEACFERHQIAKVTPELGERFDHNRHQAMFEVATDDQAPGTIAQVLQPGYVIAERLLRPALVGVARPVAGDADGGAPCASGGEDAGNGGPAPEAGARVRIDTTA